MAVGAFSFPYSDATRSFDTATPLTSIAPSVPSVPSTPLLRHLYWTLPP
jgi:hypothetical protein